MYWGERKKQQERAKLKYKLEKKKKNISHKRIYGYCIWA